MNRTNLEREAHARGIDSTDLTDRELALVLLVSCGIDLDQPIGLGSSVAIRDASDEHLLKRAHIVTW